MPLGPQHYQDAVLLAKSRANPRGLVAPLRAVAKRADPRVFPESRLLIDEYQAKLRGPRLANAIAGGVAGLVLTLACPGIFGVVSYAMKLRAKEIGIRRALGAGRGVHRIRSRRPRGRARAGHARAPYRPARRAAPRVRLGRYRCSCIVRFSAVLLDGQIR
jgi:hypothetical protein